MALQISFIRDRSKQRDPDENHAWGEFSVSSLHFYIIWFWYSFYFTFYSILKPSFFFGHHPASGLAPDPLSSFFCIPALRELQGYHRAHLAQQPHCLRSPLFPLQGTFFSHILVWQVPYCHSDSNSSVNASGKLKLTTSCCTAPQILFFTLTFITLSSLIYLSVCSLSTLKRNLNEKTDRVSYVTLPQELKQCLVTVSMLSCSVTSDSLHPLGLEPPRFLCPWNFSGRNTGMGCHFLL